MRGSPARGAWSRVGRSTVPLATRIPWALPIALIVACGGEDARSAPTRGDGQVRGVVASSKTAAGIPNLVVTLLHDGEVERAVPTDAMGAFAFDDVADGQYVVRLTGFELSDLSLLHSAFTPVEQSVTVGSDAVDLTFAVVGIIPGRVVGEVSCAGAPSAGARIRVVGGDTDVVVETDAVGRYGATDLAEGHYTVIPVDVPCDVGTEYEIVFLRSGQSVDTDFQGS